MAKTRDILTRFFFQDFKYIVKLSIKLRWGVLFFLLLLPFVLPEFSLYCNKKYIFITAALIFLYNLLFTFIVKRQEYALKRNYSLKICNYMGVIQFLLDYLSLWSVLYFTGSIYTSLFYIVIFHIVIGTIFLSPFLVFFMISSYIFIFFLISILQLNHIIPYYNLFMLKNNLTPQMIYIETIIHSVILFFTFFILLFFVKKTKADTLRLDHAKRELEKKLKEIRELELRKSKFMRFAAHQLRSPVATIIAAQNVLCKKMIPLDSERAVKLIEGAQDKAKALILIINDLLELSRIREAKKNFSLSEKVNLINLIEKIVYSLNSRIISSKQKVVRKYDYTNDSLSSEKIFKTDDEYKKFINNIQFSIEINGNIDELYSALYNIIENSIKYSPNGKNININLACSEDKVILKVKDEGIGIDEEYIDDIFQEFVRSPNAKSSINEGTGLGLSISKEILELHNAQIKVYSKINEGTEFVISFQK